MRKNLSTIIIAVATVVLAGIAVFTAIRLYQLRQQAVAPNVPTSKPKAEGECTGNTCQDGANCLTYQQQSATKCGTGGAACQVCPANQECVSGVCTPAKTSCDALTFTLGTTPTPTPSSPPSVTPTPSPTQTPAPPSCGDVCDTNNNRCPSDARNCIDYLNDSLPAVCGKSTNIQDGPKCEEALTCGSVCNTNNNRCPTSARYCVDYQGDTQPAICGTQPDVSKGPSCNVATATPKTIVTKSPTPPELPQAGVSYPAIFAMGAGVLLILTAIALAL